jgi:hypothetical protein
MKLVGTPIVKYKKEGSLDAVHLWRVSGAAVESPKSSARIFQRFERQERVEANRIRVVRASEVVAHASRTSTPSIANRGGQIFAPLLTALRVRRTFTQ